MNARIDTLVETAFCYARSIAGTRRWQREQLCKPQQFNVVVGWYRKRIVDCAVEVERLLKREVN